MVNPMHPVKVKISTYFLMAVMMCGVQISIARADNTTVNIRDSSIKWGNADQRMKLLESAPAWDDKTVQTVFSVYRDAGHHQLHATKQSRQFNIEFINSMWGPVNNPFVKYARPAKAFISFTSSPEFFMAPLVKNVTDGNFYIFDQDQARPILLEDWVARLASNHDDVSNLRFNICNGYADNLNDACSTNSYQAEMYDALGDKKNSLAVRSAEQSVPPSARRAINEDWRTMVSGSRLASRNVRGSIYDTSIDWKNGADKSSLLRSVAAWTNYKIIQQNFEKIRDIRYFDDNMVKGFSRRISWMFPDDGCWTRATAVIKDLFGPQQNVVNQFQRPSKIFAFGNLCVNTSHSSQGYVSWWYHTAPVIRDADTNEVYVLDPAVEPRKPLTVDQWMAAISANTGNCRGYSSNQVSRFAICNGYGTNPGSRCDSNYQEEESTDVMQPGFQSRERARQVELGRNANAVLGETPPWLN